jgi:hypothetical protein
MLCQSNLHSIGIFHVARWLRLVDASPLFLSKATLLRYQGYIRPLWIKDLNPPAKDRKKHKLMLPL